MTNCLYKPRIKNGRIQVGNEQLLNQILLSDENDEVAINTSRRVSKCESSDDDDEFDNKDKNIGYYRQQISNKSDTSFSTSKKSCRSTFNSSLSSSSANPSLTHLSSSAAVSREKSAATAHSLPGKPSPKPKRILSSKQLQHLVDTEKNSPKSLNSIFNRNLNETLHLKDELIKEMDSYINKVDLQNLRKKELIYKNWYFNVFEPLRKEINRNKTSYVDTVRNIRSAKYQEYLTQVNKRGTSHRDDYTEDEYDPIDYLVIDASVPGELHDPTTLAKRKFVREENVKLRCRLGRALSAKQIDKMRLPVIVHDKETRQDLAWKDWLLDQYNAMDSTVRKQSAKKCQPKRHECEFGLNWGRDLSLDTFVSEHSAYVDHANNKSKLLNAQL